jgi:hypothetical protein
MALSASWIARDGVIISSIRPNGCGLVTPKLLPLYNLGY